MKSLTITSLVILFFMVGCTNEEGTLEFLRDQGYTDIEVGGHCWVSCSEDDRVSTAFEATNSSGIRVSGCVCEGLIFKNKAIRFD